MVSPERAQDGGTPWMVDGELGRRPVGSWRALQAVLGRGLRRLSGRRPVIHLYCLCWNEARMLPFFFRHYDPLVDRYFVFDNDSTDASPDILARHPKVTIGRFDVTGDSLVGEARDFYETIWQSSRGVADWVLMVNVDELLHHARGRGYFESCARKGITIIRARGYEMISDRFPTGAEPLHRSVTSGVVAPYLNKICAFRPDAIDRIGYALGRHSAEPVGRVVFPSKNKLKLLHYKHLGRDYLIDRYRELNERMRPGDRRAGAGRHYAQSPEDLAILHRDLLAASRPVPGL